MLFWYFITEQWQLLLNRIDELFVYSSGSVWPRKRILKQFLIDKIKECCIQPYPFARASFLSFPVHIGLTDCNFLRVVFRKEVLSMDQTTCIDIHGYIALRWKPSSLCGLDMYMAFPLNCLTLHVRIKLGVSTQSSHFTLRCYISSQTFICWSNAGITATWIRNVLIVT